MILQYYVAVVAKKNTMVEVSFIAIIYTKKLLTKRYKNLKKNLQMEWWPHYGSLQAKQFSRLRYGKLHQRNINTT